MRIYRHHLYEGGSQEYLKELNVSAHENTEAEGMNHLFSIVGIQKPEEEVLSVKRNGTRDVRFCPGQFFF